MTRGTIQFLFGIISQMGFDHLVLFDLLPGASLLLLLALLDGDLLLELGNLPLQLLHSRLRLLEKMLKSSLLHRAWKHFRWSFICHGHIQFLRLRHLL